MKMGILYAVYFKGCKKINYNGEDLLLILRKGAERVGATVIGEVKYDFYPQGASAVLLLAESHYAIHTFPEEQKAAACFHTCGKIDSYEAITVVADFLKAEEIIIKKVNYEELEFKLLPET